jgi:REP element-mobilizing transposase RayT
MSTGYKIHEKDGAHFLTFQVVGWVDLFTRRDYRDVVIESFKFCQQNKGLNLFAYVIMSNHVHLIANSPLLGEVFNFVVTKQRFAFGEP